MLVTHEELHAIVLGALNDDQPAPQPAAQQGEVALPEYLVLAVDRWFSENTGIGGCSDKDVRELASIFYGIAHEGGRDSVEDALTIVESFGPGIDGLNDTYARQVLLAAEVRRLRVAQGDALSPADAEQLEKAITDFEDCGETDVPDAALQRFAVMGYLECAHYNVLPAARNAIDAARTQQEER